MVHKQVELHYYEMNTCNDSSLFSVVDCMYPINRELSTTWQIIYTKKKNWNSPKNQIKWSLLSLCTPGLHDTATVISETDAPLLLSCYLFINSGNRPTAMVFNLCTSAVTCRFLGWKCTLHTHCEEQRGKITQITAPLTEDFTQLHRHMYAVKMNMSFMEQ